MCLRAWTGPAGKGAGFGSTKPPPPSEGGGGPPPPLQPPKLSNTPRGHILAGGRPRACTTSIVRKKISSTCPCVVPLKLAVAMRKQENMHRECSIPGCSGTPWVLNIKTHLARCHPTVAPNTVDLTEWVAVSEDDEKKGGDQKNPHGDEAQGHLESG